MQVKYQFYFFFSFIEVITYSQYIKRTQNSVSLNIACYDFLIAVDSIIMNDQSGVNIAQTIKYIFPYKAVCIT